MAKYYRCALRYVGCAGGGSALAPEERRATALRLALAAVIAPTVYDLGELVSILLVHSPSSFFTSLYSPTIRLKQGTTTVLWSFLSEIVYHRLLVYYDTAEPRAGPYTTTTCWSFEHFYPNYLGVDFESVKIRMNCELSTAI